MRKLILIFFSIISLTSCLKNSDNFENGPKAQVLISNYVVNNAVFDVSFDNSSLTATPLSFGSGTGSSTDLYVNLVAGMHTIVINSGNKVVVDNVFSLSANRRYSFFLYDTLKNDSLKILMLTDDVVPVDTMAKSRFIQFIPNDSLTITTIKNTSSPVAGDTLVASDRYIGKKSITGSAIGFSTIFKPGDYKIQLSRNGNVIFTQASFVFLPGKVYSLIARGVMNGTGVYKETIAILQNN